MEATSNVWSVTGIPGSGKTAFTQALVESGGFDAVDVDEHFGHLDEIALSKDDMRQILQGKIVHNVDRAVFVKKLKIELRLLAQWLRTHPAPIMRQYIANFENVLNAQISDVSLLQYLISSGAFAGMLNLFAHRRSLESARAKAADSTRTVLLTNPGLNFSDTREEVKLYWQHNGLPSQLVVVRSRIGRIFYNAHQRERLDTTKSDPSRYDLNHILQHEPYHPKEGWSRVIAVDNLTTPEDLVTQFRSRLASQAGNTVMSDVQLLLP